MRGGGITVGRSRAEGAKAVTREQKFNVAQDSQAPSACLAERGSEDHCIGRGHRLHPESGARTKQGLVAFTCRCPRASLGSSTCVPAPGAAAADPGSCPAAPSTLLPGSEVAAPSGTLPASSRCPSPLPALHPAPSRLRSLSPAGGAGEQGRLRHLRGALGSGVLWGWGNQAELRCRVQTTQTGR